MLARSLQLNHGQQLPQVFLANTPWLRLRGLLGRPQLTREQGMLISPCNAVHTMGMSYAIDVVYLNEQLQILKITKQLKPWRSSACKGAQYTLELASGSAEHYQITTGDILSWAN